MTESINELSKALKELNQSLAKLNEQTKETIKEMDKALNWREWTEEEIEEYKRINK